MKLSDTLTAEAVTTAEAAHEAIRAILASNPAGFSPPQEPAEMDQNAAVLLIQGALAVVTKRYSIEDSVAVLGIAFGSALAQIPPEARSPLIQMFGRAMNHAGRRTTAELIANDPIGAPAAGQA